MGRMIENDSGIVAHYTPTLAPGLEVARLPTHMTVRECVAYLGIDNARVMLWGEILPESDWDTTRLGNGDQIVIRAIPQDDDTGRTVALIAVAVVAAWTGNYAAAQWGWSAASSAAIQAGVSTVAGYAGMMAVNQLFPPPQPDLGQDGDAQDQIGIGGQRNRPRPYDPLRRVFGRHRVVPDLAARPYTELVGQDQYLRMLLHVCDGPADISSIEIGETPISNFSDVQYEVRDLASGDAVPTLYTADVTQTNLSVSLDQSGDSAGSWYTRTTEPNTDEISLDLTFPKGLKGPTTFGDHPDPLRVEIEMEYREAGTSNAWNKLPANSQKVRPEDEDPYIDITGPNALFLQDNSVQNSVTDASSLLITRKEFGLFRAGVRFEVPNGQWEVRLRRYATWNVANNSGGQHSGQDEETSSSDIPDWRESSNSPADTDDDGVDDTWYYYYREDPANSKTAADVTWSALKSISHTSPIPSSGPAQEGVYIALRIRATDQLNGTIDQLSCLAEAKLPIYDAYDDSSWTGPHKTRNPAWAYAQVLRDNAEGVTDSNLDADGLKAWADYCDNQGITFDVELTEARPVHDLLRKIASVGRAQVSKKDGQLWSVSVDDRRAVSQMFTARNMRTPLSSSKTFSEPLHAVKVEFANDDQGYQRDQRVIYDDGYDSSNATRTETIRLFGCVDKHQAYRHGRYWLAVQRLRPETYTFEADWESIACEQGDVIEVNHDVPMWGLGGGRIKSVTTDSNGDTTSVTLDDVVTMESGKDYGALIRLSDLSTVQADAVTNSGEHSTIDFVNPVTGPDAGDLLSFGERSSETARLKVKEVQPDNSLGATITALDYSPEIFGIARGPQFFDPADVDTSADTITIERHGYVNGSVLQFSSDGSLPGGLSTDTDYYVVNSATDTFQVSTSEGGSAVDLTSTGSGTHVAEPQIPAFSTNITVQDDFNSRPPPKPTIEQVDSDEQALYQAQDGSLQERIRVSISQPDSSERPEAANYQLQYRASGDVAGDSYDAPAKWRMVEQDSDNELFAEPVQEGVSYDVRVRSVSSSGQASDWATVTGHTVVGKSNPPTAPANVSIINGNGLYFVISWDASPEIDVDYYRVYRDGGSGYAKVSEVDSTSWADTDLTSGTTYSYKVTAVDVAGNESADSSVVSDTAEVPPDAGATKSEVVTQSSQPNASNYNQGDIWINTSDNNRPYVLNENDVWEKTTWASIRNDTDAPEDNADVTEDHAGAINYYSSTAPSSPKEGWIWLDTSTNPNTLKRWNGSSWNDISTIGGDWDTNLLNIPDRHTDTATTGLNLTDTYLGYYDGASFQSYISSSGDFQFRGDSGNFINWDGATLTVTGDIDSSLITSSTLQTAASGKRMVVSESTDELRFYDDDGSGNIVEFVHIGSAADSFYDNFIELDGQGNTVNAGFYVRNLQGSGFNAYNISGIGIEVDSCNDGINCFYHNDTGIRTGSNGNDGILTRNNTNRGLFSYSNDGIGVYSDSNTTWNFYSADTDSTGVGDYGPFTGAHEGLIDKSVELELGDIIADTNTYWSHGLSNAITANEVADKPNSKRVVGVVIRKQAHSLGELASLSGLSESEIEDLEDHYDYLIFNALGEGLVNVCGRNGDIEGGDLIVSSDMPGKGQKQDDDLVRNYTVAKARTSITFSNSDEVQMIPCIYMCG